MKIQGLRWWVVTLIALATVINYIDRSALVSYGQPLLKIYFQMKRL